MKPPWSLPESIHMRKFQFFFEKRGPCGGSLGLVGSNSAHWPPLGTSYLSTLVKNQTSSQILTWPNLPPIRPFFRPLPTPQANSNPTNLIFTIMPHFWPLSKTPTNLMYTYMPYFRQLSRHPQIWYTQSCLTSDLFQKFPQIWYTYTCFISDNSQDTHKSDIHNHASLLTSVKTAHKSEILR